VLPDGRWRIAIRSIQSRPRRPQAYRVSPWWRLRPWGAALAVIVVTGLAASWLLPKPEAVDRAVLSTEESPDNAVLVADPTQLAAELSPDPSLDAEQRLREAVFGSFRGVTGRFGVAVKDLGTGRTVLLNETLAFQAASLYKLPVMYEVFRLRQAGSLSFDEDMTISPADAAEDLGTLIWPIGTRITLGTAVERMITVSDNSSAVMLTRRVGAGRINESMTRLGLQQTAILPGFLSTSALDMLRLLELLATGRAVDSPASAEMVSLLTRQQVRNRIPSLLPPEATVANKTGNWEDAVHDVGLVYGPSATVAIALLSDGVSDWEDVHAAMARASLAVYDVVNDPAFGSRPDPPLPPAGLGSYAEPAQVPVARPTPAPAPERLIRPEPSPTEIDTGARSKPESTAAPTATVGPTGQPATATPNGPKPTNTPRATATPRGREPTRPATPSPGGPTRTSS
jgi:beta-lactamase class A